MPLPPSLSRISSSSSPLDENKESRQSLARTYRQSITACHAEVVRARAWVDTLLFPGKKTAFAFSFGKNISVGLNNVHVCHPLRICNSA